MTDRPILFSAPMVRALLAGTKTQTRRIVKWGSVHMKGCSPEVCGADGYDTVTDRAITRVAWTPKTLAMLVCPYGQAGDRLWVRETFRSPSKHIVAYAADGTCGAWMGDGDGGRMFHRHGQVIIDPSDGGQFGVKKYGSRWVPSIHMPRWASRITLEITGVRVERLQEISAADAIADGIDIAPHHPGMYEAVLADNGKGSRIVCAVDDPTEAYCALWNMINGSGAWAANPWVWVVEFKRVTP
jgi:hypothetical protein